MSNDKKEQPLPPLPFVEDGSDFAVRLRQQQWIDWQRRQAVQQQVVVGAGDDVPLLWTLPTLLSHAILEPIGKHTEGQLIRAVTLPIRRLVELLLRDPAASYGIDPRKWEEIVASTYDTSGEFDEVVLTPRSHDGGKDLVAIKKGVGKVLLIESIKRYTPQHYVKASDVRDALGVTFGYPADKVVVSTTWRFAPEIEKDPAVAATLGGLLELVDGDQLFKRLDDYTKPKP